MGKVRNHIKDPSAALAQWVKRKLVNHDPMSVSVKGKRTNMEISHQEGQNDVYYDVGDGRRFRISVEEVNQGGEDSITKMTE